MALKKRKIAGIIATNFFSVVSICAVIAGTILYGLINNYLYGSGVEISGESAEAALEYSDSLCKEIAEEGTVLLQNKDDFLPIPKSMLANVNVFGWRGSNTGWIGGASGSVNGNNKSTKAKIVPLLDAIETINCEYNQELAQMYEDYCDVGDGKALEDGVRFFTLKEPTLDYYTPELMANAIEYSDTAIVVLGRQGGEGVDLPNYQLKLGLPTDNTRGYLDISTEEEDLLELVTTNFENVIVIVDAVNMMNFNFLHKYENIDACLWCSGPGQSGSHSLLRLIRGKVTPSAKLVNTLPNEFDTDPSFQNVTGVTNLKSDIHYAEDIYVGYRWYETADVEGYWDNYNVSYEKVMEDGSKSTTDLTGYNAAVQFPFGFGLSYTEFEWELESFTATNNVLTKDTTFNYSVKVTNVGERKGKDVVELYVNPPYIKGGIEKTSIALVDYAKTELLLPGDEQILDLTFSLSDIASYDCYDKNNNKFFGYELDAGQYTVSFRTDVHTLKEDMANNALNYNLAQGVQYPLDPVTGNPVENRFTRYQDGNGTTHTPYADCAIDGSDADQADITYMSRADFVNTFPETIKTQRSGSKISSGRNYTRTPQGSFTMPTTNSGGNLRMYLSTDGSNPTASQLQASKDIKPNKELLMELGKSFDSELWEQLLDQMTVAEMDNLIQLGGYKTSVVETIGKKYMLDNDGGSGLNRHIQEADKGNNPDRSSWTLFPSTNMLAASWNKRLAYNYGMAIGAEAVTSGIDGWYSPACNMHRSLYDGRIAEYPSEDPLFAGIVTAEQVRGAMNNGIYTYVKHFAVNENENGRAGIKTWLTEQSLRELYLRPFEIAVKRGGTVGIMASMNCIGNTLAKYNGALMDDVLRNEWGFHGTVITDWEGSGSMLKGLYAGLDLWLTGAQVKVSAPVDASNAMQVTYARKACHNILWAKVAAYTANQTHDPADDNISVDTDIIVARTVHFGWWYVGLWGICGTVVVGTVVYCLYAFGVIKFKRKTKDLTTTAKKE